MKNCKGGFTFKQVSTKNNLPLEDEKLGSPHKEKMFNNSEISHNDNEKIWSNNYDKSSNGEAEQNTRELLMEKNEMAALCRGCYIY